MDEKKKMMVLGGLVVIVLAVGAFQFTQGGSPAPSPAPTKAKVAVQDKAAKKLSESTATYATDEASNDSHSAEQVVNKEDVQHLVVAAAMTSRDPFDDPSLHELANAKATPPVKPLPEPKATHGSRPPHFGGSVPPFNPNGLPNAEAGGIAIDRGTALKMPGDFNYSASGVILGNKPAAVITDSNGNQRLIGLGSSIDGDSKVVSIQRGRVIVRHRDKTITLSVGGSSNEK